MSYPMTADGGPDDLPRTFRRERDAREREARERLAAERAQAERESLSMGPAPVAAEQLYVAPDASYPLAGDGAIPATVTRFQVPFWHLVAFFLKAAVAAIPALLLLGMMVWGAGHLLQTYFPWLVKARILIHFPN